MNAARSQIGQAAASFGFAFVLVAMLESMAAAEVPVLRPGAIGPGVVARFVTAEMRHPSAILEVAWSRDGKLLACGGGPFAHWKSGRKTTDPEYRGRTEEYAVSVFDAEAQTLVARCSGHDAFLVALTFSDDGTSLATIDGLGVVCCWETRSGKLVWEHAVPDAELPLSKFGASVFMRFSADGKRLGLATRDEHVTVLDAASGRSLDAYSFAHSSAEVFDDQLRLLRVDLDRKIGFADRKERKPDDDEISRRGRGADKPQWQTVFEALAPTGAATGAAIVVERVGRGEVVRLDRPDGTEAMLATRATQGRTEASFSRDGKSGLVTWSELNGDVYESFIFNVSDGQITRRFQGRGSHLDFSDRLADAGDRLAVVNDRTIQLFALPAGNEVTKITVPHVTRHAELSPDGKVAALYDDNSLQLWDVERQNIRWSLPIHGGLVGFSHDSRRMALSTYFDGVKLIDVDTCTSTVVELPKLPEETRPDGILRVRFSADDRTLEVWRRTSTWHGNDGRSELERHTIELASGVVRSKPIYGQAKGWPILVPSGRGNNMYYTWTLSPHAKRLVMWGSPRETALSRWYEKSWIRKFGIDLRIQTGGSRAMWSPAASCGVCRTSTMCTNWRSPTTKG